MTLFDWPMWALAVFAYVIIQRLAELAYANANTRRLLAEGGLEHGAKHYPLFILLHSGWLIAIALFAAPSAAPDLLSVALALVEFANGNNRINLTGKLAEAVGLARAAIAKVEGVK